MVVVVSALFWVAIPASLVVASEISPVVDDRVESPVDFALDTAPLAPLVDEGAQKRRGWELGVVISAAYDSNIFLNSTRPTGDSIYRLGPRIAYSQGDDLEGEGGFIKTAYQPTAVFYAKSDSENRVDHDAVILAGWRGKATVLTFKGGIRVLGDATADTGSQTDRIEFENEIRMAWLPRGKVTLEAAVGNRQANYDDSALFDSNKTYGEVAALYAYSPKTRVGLAYQVGRFEVDGASAQTTQQLTAGIDWQPREKIRITLEAGAEHRKTDNGSKVRPVLEGRIDWTPSEGTNLYLTAYQREEASAFFVGQNYRVKGATAGISQRLGKNWTGRLDGGYETNDYSQVSGSGGGGREDRIWFVRPALEYRISDKSNIALFYRTSDNRSNNPSFGYEQWSSGIELNYQF